MSIPKATMRAAENVRPVQNLFAAFGPGDVPTVRPLLADEDTPALISALRSD